MLTLPYSLDQCGGPHGSTGSSLDGTFHPTGPSFNPSKKKPPPSVCVSHQAWRLINQLAKYLSRGGNVTLHIRARYQYGHVTYTGYEIATHYAIGIRIFTLVLKP